MTALSDLQNQFSGQGDLDAAIAVRDEIAHHRSASASTSPNGTKNPEKLQRLIDIFEAETLKRTRPMMERTLQSLEDLKIRLTKQGKLDDASYVAKTMATFQTTQELPTKPENQNPISPTSARGLVAHYDFNESAGKLVRDKSGHRNHAKRNRAVESATGIEGEGAQFIGSKGAIGIDFAHKELDTLHRRSYTLSAWYRPDENANPPKISEAILAKAGRNQGIQLVDRRKRFLHEFWIHDTNKATTKDLVRLEVGYSPPDYQRGQWYHVVGRHDAEARTVSLFLNGKPVQRKKYPKESSVRENTRSWHIGCARESYCPAQGVIDDVRIYDRALTKDEIEQLYYMFSGEGSHQKRD